MFLLDLICTVFILTVMRGRRLFGGIGLRAVKLAYDSPENDEFGLMLIEHVSQASIFNIFVFSP